MKFGFICTTALILTACSAPNRPISPALEGPSEMTLTVLGGSEWTPINPADNAPEQFVAFKLDGSVTGFAGCNNFFGDYTVEGDKIIIGPLASTRKMCPESMAAETAFLQKLQAAQTFTMTPLELILREKNPKDLLTLRRRDWD